MLGNLGAINSTFIVVPDDSLFGVPHYLICYFQGSEQCKLEKSLLAWIYTVTDMVGIVFFALAYIWLRYFERREITLVDSESITAGDFTVMVRGLPLEAPHYELALKRHLPTRTRTTVGCT